MFHITYIVTDPMTINIYLKPHFEALVESNWQVSVICGGDRRSLPSPEELHGIKLYHVPMRREIAPITDGLAFVQLFWLLVRLRPTIVNAGTPKAGLLGMVASRLAGVPLRIYQLHGLRLETATGWRRRLFLLTERLACRCSHKVICVSKSLKGKVVELGVCPSEKLAVLGFGSCTGLRFADYAATPERLLQAAALKKILNIPTDAAVLGYIGRLTRDKGIVDLLNAFALVRHKAPSTYLLLLGPFEDGDPIPEHLPRQISEDPYIRRVEWADDARPYFHMIDVFVLPTYREGLPGVLLEAAATGTPIVATRATGVVDVVVNEHTGLISAIGDVHAMAQNILKMLFSPELAADLSRHARSKVEAEFSRGQVLQQLELFYRTALSECGVGV